MDENFDRGIFEILDHFLFPFCHFKFMDPKLLFNLAALPIPNLITFKGKPTRRKQSCPKIKTIKSPHSPCTSCSHRRSSRRTATSSVAALAGSSFRRLSEFCSASSVAASDSRASRNCDGRKSVYETGAMLVLGHDSGE